LSGYAYYVTKNPAYARKAIGSIALGGGNNSANARDLVTTREITGPDAPKVLMEAVNGNGIITNGINQSSLNTIEVLELCKDQLPTEVPPPAPAGGRGGFGGRGGRGGRAGAGAAPAGSEPAASTP
jgi:hypothetical protein